MDTRIPITRTKLIIPRRRSDLMSRQRLLDAMAGFMDLKLAIIAAPAGYGKTSLLVDFLQHEPQIPACWFGLDALDQDPVRFIAHLIASIQLVFPKFGQLSMAALQNANPDDLNLDGLVSAIVNDLSENVLEHFLVVLDDYHLIEESRPVTHFINQFIQLTDENCQLIIASRTLLNLPDMPLLVAHAQVGGLSFEVLSFSANEISRLWDFHFGLDLPLEEAEKLEQETEGWITGLLLTQQTSGSLSDRMIRARVTGVNLYDYLAQQVLDRQTPEIQQFLMFTALLEEFDAQICAEVIGSALHVEADWQGLIDSLFRLNLFLQPVGDEEHLWLRYHHLFQVFLRERARRSYPEESRAIERALADLWITQGEWERAYEILSRLGPPAEVAEFIAKAGSALIARGRLSMLTAWLQALPHVEIQNRPELLSLQGAASLIRGNAQEGLSLLDQAIARFELTGETGALSRALVRRATADFQLGKYQESLVDSNRALELNQSQHDPQIDAEALNNLGMNAYRLGDLTTAWEQLRKSRASFEQLQDLESAAKIDMHLGMVAKAMGNFEEAQNAYTTALEHYRRTSNLLWQATLLNNLGVLQHQNGDFEHAAASFEQAIELGQEGGIAQVEAYSLASIGDLYRDISALQEAREAYRQARPVSLRLNDRFLLFYLDLSEAMLATLENHPEKAERLLVLAGQSADLSGSPYQKNLVRQEGAVLSAHKGDYTEAIRGLRETSSAFSKAGHKAEMIRSGFHLAAILWKVGEHAQSYEALRPLLALQEHPDNLAQLSLTGSELLPFLRELHDSSYHNTQIASLYRAAVSMEYSLPALRRSLRRKTQSVPIGPPHIHITTLGQVQVRSNNRQITTSEWVGQSSRDLLLLLLAHPDGLTKGEAEAMIWPEGSFENAGLRFKNAIYRVRKALGKDVILFDESVYRFNRSLDYEEDAETFERYLDLAAQTTDEFTRIQNLENALALYKGSYLADLDSDWVLTRRSILHDRYINGQIDLIRLFLKHNRQTEAVNLSTRILKEEPANEEAYRLGMQAHAAMGNWTAVDTLYTQCTREILLEHQRPPTRATRELYQNLKH